MNRRELFARLAAVAMVPFAGLVKPKLLWTAHFKPEEVVWCIPDTLFVMPIVLMDKIPQLGTTGDLILVNQVPIQEQR